MILPFMIGAKLSLVAHMDVFREAFQIVPKRILIVGRIEFCVADVQIEIRFWFYRSDGLQGLVKESEGFWDLVRFAAEQRFSHTFAGIHGTSKLFMRLPFSPSAGRLSGQIDRKG
jgi:hypothetical protein